MDYFIKDLLEKVFEDPATLINIIAVITNIIVILISISSISKRKKPRIGCAGMFTIAFLAIVFGAAAVYNHFGGGSIGFKYAAGYVILAFLFFVGLQLAREEDEKENP